MEIVPPVRPVPAVMLVTVPVHCVIVVQARPEVQAEFAVRTWLLVPTGRATGVEAAVPAIKSPLAVMQEQGIAELAAAVAQVRPLVHAEQAVST